MSAPARHILTYAQSLRGGGVERAQLRLAAGWAATGRRVTLVIGDASGPLAADLSPEIELVPLESSDFSAMLKLPAHLLALAPDILFCPGNHYTGIAAWTRLWLGQDCPPIVGKLSNSLRRADQHFPVAQAYRAWSRQHPRFIDHLVAMTPAMRTEAIEMMGFPPERTSVIANPPARHQPTGDAPALPAGRFLLGVGRLVPQKRWDRLIEAMPRLADRDVSLMILGEGAERERLERKIAALELGGRVSLPGHATNPSTAITRAAAVVLTSHFEGAPGVLREALARGTPVVATESSVAVREIVTAPALGSVVPVHDADALVAALDHWLVPGRARPAPIAEPGEGAANAYLALFDRIVRVRL